MASKTETSPRRVDRETRITNRVLISGTEGVLFARELRERAFGSAPQRPTGGERRRSTLPAYPTRRGNVDFNR